MTTAEVCRFGGQIAATDPQFHTVCNEALTPILGHIHRYRGDMTSERPASERWTRTWAALAIIVAFLSMTNAASAQLTPIDEEPGTEAPGLGDIVGSPEAGPAPEDAGDRGGWAQLSLAVLMAGAVLFIGSRIRKEARAGRTTSRPPRDVLGPNASTDGEL